MASTSIQTTIDAAKKRKLKIMSEVLPTEQIWNEWVKNESRARQGKGYYPSLDRRFLEFLVSCEIDLLSVEHSLTLDQPADKVHRNTDKVRRVASQRIGNERLEAYRARVKEAFEAYFRGSVWATWDDDAVTVNSLEDEYDEKAEEERGRGKLTKEVQVTVHWHNQVSKHLDNVDLSMAMDVDESSRPFQVLPKVDIPEIKVTTIAKVPSVVEKEAGNVHGVAITVPSEMEVDQAI